MKGIILVLLIALPGCIGNTIKTAKNENLYTSSSVKRCYILDGKQVPDSIYGKALNEERLETVFFGNAQRHAILNFGEKYREGIVASKIVRDEE